MSKTKHGRKGRSSATAATRAGASLVTFPETYLPGYLDWVWRLRPGDDFKLAQEIHRKLTPIAFSADGESQ
jgi:nitrilase